ncbi:Ribosomal protein S18 acetylase RimI [Rhizobium tibeticum]|uniref:Putative acetyltransferase n=1 Tax=Rhizobium tibeticum TaxID=501024 RepID=A0A1H8U7U2_9HYPH|nr:GNAT family N-acetyltransferase [Rhizobium tibeticum]SEI16238.1 putative acetyltransferase [Rhizobium tibeticum]SEO99127.1 Ribosomal protein S18 acetylase RimI [Rhizobium tibeticum]
MIHQLRSDDEAQWRTLWTQYLAFDGSVLDIAIHDGTWCRLLDEGERVHGALAVVDADAVGFVHYVFHPSTWSLSDACYLQDLFVAPTMRGRGIGRALISHVCAEAAAAGSSRVYWQTQADNAAAIALYDKVAERSGYIQFRKPVV